MSLLILFPVKVAMQRYCGPYFAYINALLSFVDLANDNILLINRMQLIDTAFKILKDLTITQETRNFVLVMENDDVELLPEVQPLTTFQTDGDMIAFEAAREKYPRHLFQKAGLYFQSHLLQALAGFSETELNDWNDAHVASRNSMLIAVQKLFRLPEAAGLGHFQYRVVDNDNEEENSISDSDSDSDSSSNMSSRGDSEWGMIEIPMVELDFYPTSKTFYEFLINEKQRVRSIEIDMYNASFHGRENELRMILTAAENKLIGVNWAEPELGMTAAFVAAQRGHAGCLSILVQNNAELTKMDHRGWAPIHIACQYGRLACIELLAHNNNAAGVNAHMAHELSRTPLIIAATNGHVKCMALLLDRGADPNLAVSSSGTTAGIMACQFGYLTCLQLLVKRGADINIRDRNGYTLLDTARAYQQPECVDFLLTTGRANGMGLGDIRFIHNRTDEYFAALEDHLARQRDARRCDYPACHASASDLRVGERFKKCHTCRTAIYCGKSHAMRHMSEHVPLCMELTRICDDPACNKPANIDIKCRQCRTAMYCCKRHRANHSLAHESRCEELVLYR